MPPDAFLTKRFGSAMGPCIPFVVLGRSRMFSYTPWYITLGEFGIALTFALLGRGCAAVHEASPLLLESLVEWRSLLTAPPPFWLQIY